MAAAVALHLELEVEETGEFAVDPGGLEVSTGRDNLIVRAFETLHPADGIAFRLRSEIPLARGLGSSAAAIVAGLAAADHLFELALTPRGAAGAGDRDRGAPRQRRRGDLRRLRRLRARGGEAPFAARFDPPEGLEGIVVIPGEEVSTRLAREAIPAELPLADAVANVSAAALLVLGLRSADLDLVGRGLHDRIHQPRRRELYPRSMEIVDAAAELGALGATISGAGPTVLVWTTWEEAGGVAAALKERCRGLGRGQAPALRTARRRRPRALSQGRGQPVSCPFLSPFGAARVAPCLPCRSRNCSPPSSPSPPSWRSRPPRTRPFPTARASPKPPRLHRQGQWQGRPPDRRGSRLARLAGRQTRRLRTRNEERRRNAPLLDRSRQGRAAARLVA